MTGPALLLNGPSTAAKTTLARAIVQRLRTPWRVFPVDLAFDRVRATGSV